MDTEAYIQSMLLYNQLEYVLGGTTRIFNETVWDYYDVTGYEVCAREGEVLSMERIHDILWLCFEAIREAEVYLLPIEHLVLELDCLFYSKRKEQGKVLFQFSHQESIMSQLQRLIEQIMIQADHSKEGMVSYLYELYAYVLKSPTLEELYRKEEELWYQIAVSTREEERRETNEAGCWNTKQEITCAKEAREQVGRIGILQRSHVFELMKPRLRAARQKYAFLRNSRILGRLLEEEQKELPKACVQKPQPMSIQKPVSEPIPAPIPAPMPVLMSAPITAPMSAQQKEPLPEKKPSVEAYAEPVIQETLCYVRETEVLWETARCSQEGPKMYLKSVLDEQELIQFTSASLIIGRNKKEVDYYIPDQSISRQHANVFCQDGKCYVVDLRSANGTYINGERIKSGEIRQLVSNDTVQFATVGYQFISCI